MAMIDYFWISVVVAGAVYILYKSIIKKDGGCHGCCSGACSHKPEAKE
ncbi:MAG: FeoB-associated Cys-rich membrane protein [Nitrospirota bacterium]